jgi:hypothetical protein
MVAAKSHPLGFRLAEDLIGWNEAKAEIKLRA